LGQTSFDRLRRTTPISREFGLDRGQPTDRYYIESFLARQAGAIRGHALEVADNSYTRKYGGGRVTTSDVLDVREDNPRATVIADLTSADDIPSDTFDCIICTQTLQLIYDVRSAIQTLFRILKPGGVLLVTVPGISHTGPDADSDYWCWAFTAFSTRRLFEESFPAANLEIEAYGNVLAAISFLHGLAAEELRQEELDFRDPYFQVVITIRAEKPKPPYDKPCY
jgi:SAM-dependent methyltransferase